MRRLWLKLFSCVCVAVLASCQSVDETPAPSTPSTPKTLAFGTCAFSSLTPTEVSGRLHVYDAMARAAKYNSLTLAQNMQKKIYSENPNMSPKDVIDTVVNTPDKGGAVYNGVRVLDYALMYAGVYLSENTAEADKLILQKSAQSLALAAVKTQGDVMTAEREIRDINSLEKAEQKNLAALNARYNNLGKLSAEELDYKTTIETSLLNLERMRDGLIDDIIAYRQLVKNDNKKLELDGRKFYELDVFDKKLTPEIYQRAALENRVEFQLPLAKLNTVNYAKIHRYANLTYDMDKSQELGGVDANSELYDEALQGRALSAANALIDALIAYHSEADKDKNARLRDKIFDELAASIFVQIDLMYQVVLKADVDFQTTSKEIAELSKEINRLKNRSLGPTLKADLLRDQVKLVSLKIKQNRIRAERTTAMAALYFYAGYAPFDCGVLNSSPEEIAAVLKSGFNADRIRLLTAAMEKVSAANDVSMTASRDDEKGWAQGENWLEEVVEGASLKASQVNQKSEASPYSLLPPVEKTASSYQKAVSSPQSVKTNLKKLKASAVLSEKDIQPKGNFEPYTHKDADELTYMQLGAYVYAQNSEEDWARLSKAYPALKNYKLVREKAVVDGKNYTRLLIYSPNGHLSKLCNELRQNHEECFLK